MDTFWLKAVIVLILIAAVVIGIAYFASSNSDKPPKEPQKTFYDVKEEDRKQLLAEPSAKDFQPEEQQPAEKPAEKQTDTQQAVKQPEPEVSGPITLYFRDMDPIEKVEADRQLQMLPSGRSIGRLPMTGYNLMVKSCNTLMNRWPGTVYDYKARRALAQMPERFWKRYKITEELISLKEFKLQRPETKPYKIQE